MAAMRSRAAGRVAAGGLRGRPGDHAPVAAGNAPDGRASPPVLGVVLDRLALDQEDHVLADVGGEVGHALEVPAHQEELHAGADHVRVLHHVRQQDAEDGAVQRVDLVVPQADLAACGGVAPDEGLERVGQHVAGQPGHLDDLGLRRDGPGLRSAARRDWAMLTAWSPTRSRSLAILSAEVSMRRSRAIGCWSARRLMHCSSISTSMLSMTRSPAMTRPALSLVALEQRLDREAERRLRLARHREQAHLDVAQLVVEVAMDVDAHPNLPVM